MEASAKMIWKAASCVLSSRLVTNVNFPSSTYFIFSFVDFHKYRTDGQLHGLCSDGLPP